MDFSSTTFQYLSEWHDRISEFNNYCKSNDVSIPTAEVCKYLMNHPVNAVIYHMQTKCPIEEVVNYHPEYYL